MSETSNPKEVSLYNFVTNTPPPVVRLLVELAPLVGLARWAAQVCSWKSTYVSESWLAIFVWWAICLSSEVAFKYLLPFIILSPIALRQLAPRVPVLRRWAPVSNAVVPATESTVSTALADVQALESLLPHWPPLPETLPPPPVIARILLTLYVPYLLATTFISAKVLVAVAGTAVLAWRSPWLCASRKILARSGWVQFLIHQSWAALTGLPQPAAGSFSLTSSPRKPLEKISPTTINGLDTPELPEPAVVRFTFSVMENQRWWVGLDWTAALLPSDRPSWCSVPPSLSPLPSPGSLPLPGPTTVFLPLPSTRSAPSNLRMKRTSKWKWDDGDWCVVVGTTGKDGAVKVDRVKMDLPLDAEGLGNGSAARLVDAVGKGLRRGQTISGDDGRPPKEHGHPAAANEKETSMSPTANGDAVADSAHQATDVDGWAYADNKWEHPTPKGGIGKYTRMRRWTRVAVLEEKIEVVPGDAAIANGSSTHVHTAPESVMAPSTTKSSPLRQRTPIANAQRRRPKLEPTYRQKMLTQEDSKWQGEDHLRESTMSKLGGHVAEDSESENNLIMMKAPNVEELRRRNQRQPISNIPEHILLDIFLIVLEDTKLWAYYITLHILSQVSADWALLIRESPSLWCLINFHDSAEIHHIAFSRSKDSPIDIIYSLSDERGGNDPLIARLILQSHRWRSLEYYGFPNRCWLDDLHGVQAPKLERLDIHVAVRPRVLELFRGEAPALKYLYLSGCSIDWRSNMLSGLKTLHLYSIEPTCPSVDDLVNILCASPTLLNFDLCYLKCEAPRDDLTLYTRPIELLYLETFSLCDLPLLTVQSLLRVLRIPACIQLTLDVRPETPLDLFDASMDHILSVMNKILASKKESSRSSFLIMDDTVTIQRWPVDTGRLKLNVSVRGDAGMDSILMERLVKVFESPRAVDLENLALKGSASTDFPSSLIQPIFRSSLRSRCLRISGRIWMDETLRCLGEPITVDGTTRWPLLSLQTIELVRFPPKINILLDMVKRRYEADPDLDNIVAGSRSMERPAALNKLGIETPFNDADAAEVQRLKSILGEGVVEWKSSEEMRMVITED
ncbi:hypothetical protein FRB98_006220 [Tulasnella sp. 332]|nr:hypothetical protein FRB98_006220 [Tulasnella sp. 332]